MSIHSEEKCNWSQLLIVFISVCCVSVVVIVIIYNVRGVPARTMKCEVTLLTLFHLNMNALGNCCAIISSPIFFLFFFNNFIGTLMNAKVCRGEDGRFVVFNTMKLWMTGWSNTQSTRQWLSLSKCLWSDLACFIGFKLLLFCGYTLCPDTCT